MRRRSSYGVGQLCARIRADSTHFIRECGTADLFSSAEAGEGIGIASLVEETARLVSMGISELVDVVVVSEEDVAKAMTLGELDDEIAVVLLALAMALPRLVVFHWT
jgi:hypothetical protein